MTFSLRQKQKLPDVIDDHGSLTVNLLASQKELNRNDSRKKSNNRSPAEVLPSLPGKLSYCLHSFQ